MNSIKTMGPRSSRVVSEAQGPTAPTRRDPARLRPAAVRRMRGERERKIYQKEI